MTNGDLNRDLPSPDRQACHTVREQLAEYATFAALGNPALDGFSEVTRHLASCGACQAVLDELLALTLATYTGEVPAAPDYPVADLSFLPAANSVAIAERPWYIDHLGRLIITFSRHVLDTIQPSPLLGATRGNLLYRYIQEPNSISAMAVIIEVSRESKHPGLVDVRVAVELLRQNPLAQADSSVTLAWDDTSLQINTDDSGCANFTDIPIQAVQSLRVEITPRAS